MMNCNDILNIEYLYANLDFNEPFNLSSFIQTANATQPCPRNHPVDSVSNESYSIISNNNFNEIPLGTNLIELFEESDYGYRSKYLTLNTAPEESSIHVFTVKLETAYGSIFEVHSDTIILNLL